MHTRCPHCHHPIEIVQHSLRDLVDCPSCGSTFNLLHDGESTATYQLGPNRTVAHFDLLNELGQGQFGVVWKAFDKTLRRTVALKIPRPGNLSAEHAEFFFRDARVAAQLNHPGIVRVHEVGRADELLFISSELIEGADLKDWLTANPLSPREAAALMVQVADAVDHAHRAGVVHRDLKPSNILIDLDGKPHVADFGLAKRDSTEMTIAVDGKILGTPKYMSPEQAAGQSHLADARSDVYSLGVILFELLTGEAPFRGEKRMLLVQIQREEPPSLRKLDARIPRDLETICLRCLEKPPTRRYQSAAEFAQELRRFLGGEPILARPIGWVSRAWRWAKREPAIAAMSLALAASMIVGTAIATYSAIDASARATQLAIEKDRAEQAEKDIRKLTGILLPTVAARSSGLEDANATAVPITEMSTQVEASIDREFANRPLEIHIRHAIGSLWRDIGLFDQSQGQLERALQLADAELGRTAANQNPELVHRRLAIRNSLAICFSKSGRHDKAIRLHQENFRDAEALNDPEAFLCLVNLSAAQAGDGRLPDACGSAADALALAKFANADAIRQLVSCMGSLMRAAKSAETAKLILPTIEAIRKAADAQLPKNDAVRMQSLHDYAVTRLKAKLHDSETLLALQAVYEARRDTLGADDRNTLASQSQYARELLDHDAAAATLLLADLRSRELRTPGVSMGDSLSTTLDLVDAYHQQRQFTEAQQVLKATLAAETSKWPAAHRLLLQIAVGVNQLGLGDFKGSEMQLRQYAKLIPAGSLPRAEADCHLGASLLGQGRYADAEKYLARGYQVLQESGDSLSNKQRKLLRDTQTRLDELKKRPREVPRPPTATEP